MTASDVVLIAVDGNHFRTFLGGSRGVGQHIEPKDRGAGVEGGGADEAGEEVVTAPRYRLWCAEVASFGESIADGGYPGLTEECEGEGDCVTLELFGMPAGLLKDFAQSLPAGLALGKVALGDGRVVLAVVMSAHLTRGQRDISSFGGWAAYKKAAAGKVQNNGVDDPGVVVTLPAMPSELKLPLKHTAVVFIDFQRDFLLPGGFGCSLGNDVSNLKGSVVGGKRLLSLARDRGLLVVHTLEAHTPCLTNCPSSKLERGVEGKRIGDQAEMGRILVRGEYGNELIDELAALEGEKCIHKPGKGAFWATDMHSYLQGKGITHLIFAGVTTEVCVQTTMREANDRGYYCCVVEDATDSYFPEYKAATLEMIRAQAGIVGWTIHGDDVVKAFQAADDES